MMTQAAYKAAFSSVEMPLVQGVRAKIEGSVPKWLKGAFVRNGPGVFGVSDSRVHAEALLFAPAWYLPY